MYTRIAGGAKKFGKGLTLGLAVLFSSSQAASAQSVTDLGLVVVDNTPAGVVTGVVGMAGGVWDYMKSWWGGDEYLAESEEVVHGTLWESFEDEYEMINYFRYNILRR